MALKSSRDWKDSYELYHAPIIAAAQLAAFSTAECEVIFQETLSHMIKKGFKHCLSNKSLSVAGDLSCAAYRRLQRASRRRKIGCERKDSNSVFGSVEILEQIRFQEFVFEGVAKCILEAFIERGLFSDTVLRSAHAVFVGAATRGSLYLQKVGGSFNDGEDDAYKAAVKALMIVHKAIEGGASLDEAFRYPELSFSDQAFRFYEKH